MSNFFGRSMLDSDEQCDKVQTLVVGARRTSEKKRERENSEYRIQNPEDENHQIQGRGCRARGGQDAEQEGKQIGRQRTRRTQGIGNSSGGMWAGGGRKWEKVDRELG